ncbi:MAG: glycosyltransferase [Armatimonadota bacterium]
MPCCSVVIPLYNKEPYIGRAVESVLAQTLADFELLVVDDGSTDGSAAAVRRFDDPRVRLISQENRGEGPARARGMAEAAGTYIAFLDADDRWSPQFLEKAVRLLEDYPQAALGGLGYAMIRPDGTEQPMRVSMPSSFTRGLLDDFFRASLQDPPISSSSSIIRRAMVEALRPEASPSRIGADQYLWAQIALRSPVALDTEVQAYYHVDADCRALNVYRTEEELPFVQLIKQRMREGAYGTSSREALHDYVSFYQLSTVHRALRGDGDIATARKLLALCRPAPAYRNEYLRCRMEAALPKCLRRPVSWIMIHKKVTVAAVLAFTVLVGMIAWLFFRAR